MSKSIIFALFISIFVGLAYFGFQKISYRLPIFFQSKSTTSSALSLITPAPSPSHGDKQSTNEKARMLAEKFLNLVKQQQGKEVLALFTPSETKKEANSYSYLAGLDLVAPRVFSTANLNFHLLSADIVAISQNDDGTIFVDIKESRRTYDNTSAEYFDKLEKTEIVLKTIGWNWYVDKYFYKDDPLTVENKYNALYPRN